MDINIGIVGLGNIGSGVLDLIEKNNSLISSKIGHKIRVKTIIEKNIQKVKELNLSGITVSDNIETIIDDPEIQIVVEVIGGETPAYDLICALLKAGKNVVTANKEVVAKHKNTFLKLAQENNVSFCFEASVGGSIPLIQALKLGFAANNIKSFYGILNGTTNYILTKIEEDKKDFNDVLQNAQDLGLAEADPTMDISGLDAAYKLNILAAVSFNADLEIGDISYEGIENISLKDIEYAKEFGYKIKLLAIGSMVSENRISCKVHPTMIPISHPIAGIRNEFNALFLVGDAVGEAMLYGKGAGAIPTASAIISDIIDISFSLNQNCVKKQYLAINKSMKNISIEETSSQFYIRMLAKDTVGMFEKIAGVLGENKISILNVIQKDIIKDSAEIVIITHDVLEKNMNKALQELESLSEISKLLSVIRVGL
jgi:homoserine dehydrogenase